MEEKHDILIISNGFFGYSKQIGAYLRQNGRIPKVVEDRPATDTLTKTLIRINPALLARRSEQYFAGLMEGLRDHPLRDVLVIRGEALSPQIVRRMRQTWPNARFTLYFWDSFRNLPAPIVEAIPLFDRALSFDPEDVRKEAKLTYRPLFFLDPYRTLAREAVKPEIDVLFIGTLHSDRARVLYRIAKALPRSVRLHTYLYLRTGIEYLFYSALAFLTKPPWTLTFIRTPLSTDEITALYARSNAILDIERSIQTGYTIRTIEVLASGKKLITTNPEVASADFYDDNNIMVIDRDNPDPDPTFLQRPVRPAAEQIVRQYTLASWVADVLPETAATVTSQRS